MIFDVLFLKRHVSIENILSAYNLQLVQTREDCGDGQGVPHDFNFIADIVVQHQTEGTSVAGGDEVKCVFS